MLSFARLCAVSLALLLTITVTTATTAQDSDDLDLSPTDCVPSEEYTILADEALAEDDYVAMVQHLSCAIKLDSTDMVSLYRRGWALTQLEEYTLAIEDYDRALELSPDDAFTLNNRAWAYELLGEMEQSASDYLAHILARRTERVDWWLFYDFTEFIVLYPEEYYTFTFLGEAGNIIDIVAESADGSIDPLIVIVDPNGDALYANDDRDLDNEDYNSAIEGFIIPETGEYTLYLTQWMEDDNIGDVEVTLSPAPEF